MKKYRRHNNLSKRWMFICVILFNVHLCSAQNKPYPFKLVIRDLNDTVFCSIQERSRTKDVPITSSTFDNGIKVQLVRKAKGATISVPLERNSFHEMIVDSVSADETFLKGFPKIVTDTVFLKITRDDKSAFISLVIREENVNKIELLSNCEYRIPYTPEKNISWLNWQNYYGEIPINYASNKIVYILDFNPSESDQNLYRISKSSKNWRKGGYKKKSLGEMSKVDANSCLEINPLHGKKETLKAKQSFQFKIHNVNNYRYNVVVDDSIVNFESDPPYLFRELFLGDSGGLLGSLVQAISKTQAEVAKIQSSLATTPGSESILAEIAQMRDTLLVRLTTNIYCFYSNYNALLNRVVNSTNRTINVPFETDIPDAYVNLAQSLLNIRMDVSTLSSHTTAMKSTLAVLKAESQKEKKKASGSSSTLKALNNEIDILEQRIAYYSGLDTLQKLLPTEREIQKLIVYVNGMTQQSQQYIKTIPQLSGSELKLKILIEAKDSVKKYDPSAVSESYQISLSIPIVSYWYMSFSSGTFMGFGDEFHSKTYGWRKLPSDGGTNINSESKYELAETGYEPIPAGFNALFNYQYRFLEKFGMGPSVGAGITIENSPRIAYMGGLSLSFGARRQFLLSAGILAAPINVLENNLFPGYTYDEPETLEYYKETKLGGFVSLTFTPFKSSSTNKKDKR